MIKKIIAEFIGTFFIIFLGCGIIILNDIKNIGIVSIGGAFGITLMVMIYLFGKISGANFNPAISFTFFIMGELKIIELIFYIISQLLAGLVASFFLILIFAQNFRSTILFVNQDIASLTDFNPIGIIIIPEIIFSFIIMFLYAKVTRNGKINSKRSSFFIGGMFFISTIFLISIDRIGLNSIRIFIPSLFNFSWKYIFYYLSANWIGTFLGGISYYFINKIKI